mgnify:FL=1
MADTTSPDLTARIAELNEASAYDEIIRLIESTPGYEHDPVLVGELARAYNNAAEAGETEPLEKALALLDTVDEKDRENHQWHFRRAYALFFLDRVIESLPHWEKALEYRPGDEDTLDFIRMSHKELVAERFFHPFRKRVETLAAEFAKVETELCETAALGPLGRETALERIRALFAPVANAKWLFELSEERTDGQGGKPRMKLIVSPCGWFMTAFPMRECLRRLAETASERWSFVSGIEPLDDTESLMRLVRDAGARTLHGRDLRVIPQRLEDGTWRLGFFGDDLLGVTEEEAPELFEALEWFVRKSVGEAVQMRWFSAMNLYRRTPDETGMPFAEFADFVRECVPEARAFTMEDLLTQETVVDRRPVREPDCDVLLDAFHLETGCAPLHNGYGAADRENMIELERQGITAGVFMIRLVPEASEKEKAAARAALETHLSGLPSEVVLVTGRGSALRYEFVECFAWESGPVVAAVHDFVETDPRIAWAAFHSFLREAGTLILKDLESVDEIEPASGDASTEKSVDEPVGSGTDANDGAEKAPEPQDRIETESEIQPATDDVAAEKEEPARESPIPIAHA